MDHLSSLAQDDTYCNMSSLPPEEHKDGHCSCSHSSGSSGVGHSSMDDHAETSQHSTEMSQSNAANTLDGGTDIQGIQNSEILNPYTLFNLPRPNSRRTRYHCSLLRADSPYPNSWSSSNSSGSDGNNSKQQQPQQQHQHHKHNHHHRRHHHHQSSSQADGEEGNSTHPQHWEKHVHKRQYPHSECPNSEPRYYYQNNSSSSTSDIDVLNLPVETDTQRTRGQSIGSNSQHYHHGHISCVSGAEISTCCSTANPSKKLSKHGSNGSCSGQYISPGAFGHSTSSCSAVSCNTGTGQSSEDVRPWNRYRYQFSVNSSGVHSTRNNISGYGQSSHTNCNMHTLNNNQDPHNSCSQYNRSEAVAVTEQDQMQDMYTGLNQCAISSNIMTNPVAQERPCDQLITSTSIDSPINRDLGATGNSGTTDELTWGSPSSSYYSASLGSSTCSSSSASSPSSLSPRNRQVLSPIIPDVQLSSDSDDSDIEVVKVETLINR